MKFSKMLKELRQEKGFTQAQLAIKLNVAEPTIRGWENQGLQPSYETLCELAQIFDVSVDYLLGLVDEFGNKCEKL